MISEKILENAKKGKAKIAIGVRTRTTHPWVHG